MRPVLFLLLCLLSALGPSAGRAEPLRVFASVVPIQTFVEKVGGEHVDARVMVRPGFSPHTYDPTPRQIAALAEAALFVRTGVPFEDAWMARIRSANPGMQVLDVRHGISLRGIDDGDDGHGASPPGRHRDQPAPDDHHRTLDPHLWTSPPIAEQIVGAIRDQLTELDPAHAGDFARNHDAYVAELDALDREIRERLAPLKSRRFMVFHPAWGYFADAYGLEQVPIEREGKEPGARALTALIDQARREDIRVIFVQPQLDRRQAEQVARAIGARVIAVDPLAPDYIGNLREVARQLAGAMRQ